MEDPSLGPFDPGQVQIHDFNPGDLNEPDKPNLFSEGGVFWTRSIPKKSLTIQPGKGNASFRLLNFSLFDLIDSTNAVFRTGPAPIPATASVDIHWMGTGELRKVRNDAAGFGGLYANATSTVEWSASNDEGYFFSTANSSETEVTHAFIAHVRSGVFHR